MQPNSSNSLLHPHTLAPPGLQVYHIYYCSSTTYATYLPFSTVSDLTDLLFFSANIDTNTIDMSTIPLYVSGKKAFCWDAQRELDMIRQLGGVRD